MSHKRVFRFCQSTSTSANDEDRLEELNEEDQNLKNELEMLVSRLKVALTTRSLG